MPPISHTIGCARPARAWVISQGGESSGGGANTITRSVRGLTRGNFNVEWTLATPACPCGEK